MVYDPNEARDPAGKWTSGGGQYSGDPSAPWGKGLPFIRLSDSTRAEGAARYGVAAARIANEQGFDPTKIYITDDAYKFNLNGKDMYAAGMHNKDTGLVTLYLDQLSPSSIAGVVTHEIMHVKFQAFLDDSSAEQKQIMALPHATASPRPSWWRPWASRSGSTPSDPMRADGTLRPPYDAQFPAYQARTVLMDGTNATPDLRAKMAKEDGCTPYSKDWWDQFQAGKTSVEHPYHETLSEMARLRAEPFATDPTKLKNPEAGPPTLKLAVGGEKAGLDRIKDGFLTTAPSKDWAALYKAVDEHWNKRHRT